MRKASIQGTKEHRIPQHTAAVTALAAALLMALPAAPAAASPKLVFAGPERATLVSGYGGSVKTLRPDPNAYALTGISWWEVQDDPRQVEIKARAVGTVNYKHGRAKLVNGATGNRKSTVLGGYTSYIHKIQVCTTTSNPVIKRKLKGLRVWGVIPEVKNGKISLRSAGSALTAKHTHCKKWHAVAACPTNQLAVGIRLQWNERYFSGAALLCRRLRLK